MYTARLYVQMEMVECSLMFLITYVVCIYYFFASWTMAEPRVSREDQANPLSLFFQENGSAGRYGVVTVQRLPIMLS